MAPTSRLPDGTVHHWVGRVFLPGVRLADLLAELQAADVAALDTSGGAGDDRGAGR